MRSGEKHIEEAIATAFERLPDPDPTRLKSLAERLSRATSRAPRRERSRWIYWWLILGLAATGAAAWWAGEYFTGEPFDNDVVPHTPSAPAFESGGESRDDDVHEPAGGIEDRAPNAESAAGTGQSPTIYRRERY